MLITKIFLIVIKYLKEEIKVFISTYLLFTNVLTHTHQARQKLIIYFSKSRT